MEFAKGLTPHTILILVDKSEKIVTMGALFQKMNFKVVTAISLYEALKMIDQEMPHLIICDAIIADGTAGNLYDRMQQQALFKNIPILVLVANKTKEQLSPLRGRKFAGFMLGKFDGRALTTKVKEILEGHGDISPFFVPADQCHLAGDCTLAINAKVIGRVGDQMVCQSEAEVDGEAALLCQPMDKSKGPALLKMGSNVLKAGVLYNLFPMNVIRGSGRGWIGHLPEINLDAINASTDGRRVMFYDPKPERFEQFKKVLAGYEIELIHAGNLQSAAAMIIRESDGTLGCVYLDELPANSSGIAIKEAIARMNDKARPPVIAGTTSLNAKSTREIRFLKKPFGLGLLVESMDQAFKSRTNFAEGASANIEVQFQTPAKLLGLDETGGIVQLKFPVVANSKLYLTHPVLNELWGGKSEVRIISAMRLENSNVWQAKFENFAAQGSKSRYWERLAKQIAQRLVSASA
ncbi:response regulator [Oligoflexus tunisiensis]|uniref:response regulator n=1 Tax=Oligoflexus tunisiensis TaxID=708132 RepID=UPI00114CA6D5|nr:response regulator [Oligoflexus tunisiensis]